jgi:hypothetical protein
LENSRIRTKFRGLFGFPLPLMNSACAFLHTTVSVSGVLLATLSHSAKLPVQY